MQELLIYWIKEREAIRVKKEAGEPKPWSDDEVFQRTYFCNVHREDDRVTKWIRENYTPEFFGESYEIAIVAARLFNWPPTLEAIKKYLYPDWSQLLYRTLIDKQDRKEKIWGGAYLITTHGRKMSKLDYCVETLQTALNYLPLIGGNLETCYYELRQIDGIGSFLAAQIVADLKNTDEHPLAKAEDWYIFCAPGPGSLRGLAWYFDSKVTEANFHWCIKTTAREIEWKDCMQDLQNCMCEFDKYCRVLTGSGRSKRNYPGLG